MTIHNNTFVPFEFKVKEDCYQYITERCHGIKKSLKLMEMDNEHLTLRCPLSGDYLDVTGTPAELAWLNQTLRVRRWYRLT